MSRLIQIVFSKNRYTTKSGVEISADLTLWCIGERINTALWHNNNNNNNNSDSVFETTERGQLVCDPYLRVKGHRNVFASGDAAHIVGEQNRAVHLEARATCIGANLLALMDRQEPAIAYRAQLTPPTLATLGAHSGVSILRRGVVLGGKFTARVKGADLFLGNFLLR
jgi:NADH dehydrogenase FAD-containing subunit